MDATEDLQAPEGGTVNRRAQFRASQRWISIAVVSSLVAVGSVLLGGTVLSPSSSGPNDPIIFLTENFQTQTIGGPTNWVSSAKSGWPAVPSTTYPCSHGCGRNRDANPG
jgi:hypothetical protein